MINPIKLYFDKVYNDGTNAETFDSKRIYYNFEKIDKKLFDEFTDSLATNNASSIMLPAGRFIAIISLTFNRAEQGMILMDLRNDINFARQISLKEDSQELRDRFMNVFQLISNNYEEDFDKFILVESSLPNEDI